eukprot:3932802-Alexandrium_andersonii.AAC.1
MNYDKHDSNLTACSPLRTSEPNVQPGSDIQKKRGTTQPSPGAADGENRRRQPQEQVKHKNMDRHAVRRDQDDVAGEHA